MRGLGRVEALQAFGPLQPLAVVHQSEDAQLQTQLDDLRKGLEPRQVPIDPDGTKEQVFAFLAGVTEDWFLKFCNSEYDETLAAELSDEWLMRSFSHLKAASMTGSRLRFFGGDNTICLTSLPSLKTGSQRNSLTKNMPT